MDPSLLYCSQYDASQKTQKGQKRENNPYISHKDANRYTQTSKNTLKWFKTGRSIEIDLSQGDKIATSNALTVLPVFEVQDPGFKLVTASIENTTKGIGYESAADKAARYQWKQRYEAELVTLFGNSGLFATEESLLFANIDAVAAFTQRKGGFVGRSEIKAYRAFLGGSLGLSASGYVLYRIPSAEVVFGTQRRSIPPWLPKESYYKLPDHVYSAGFDIASLVIERFAEPLDLIVADGDYPLENIEYTLRKSGQLILNIPYIAETNITSLIKVNRNLLDSLAVRFSEIAIFAPVSLLGKGIIITCRGVHEFRVLGEGYSVGFEQYLFNIAKKIEEQASLPWDNPHYFQLRRCNTIWNLF